MKSSQEASYLSVGGCDTMKSSWCNVLAISSVVGHVINDEQFLSSSLNQQIDVYWQIVVDGVGQEEMVT